MPLPRPQSLQMLRRWPSAGRARRGRCRRTPCRCCAAGRARRGWPLPPHSLHRLRSRPCSHQDLFFPISTLSQQVQPPEQILRIPKSALVRRSQNTQITSHRACGLGKQKSEACFAFWRLQDHTAKEIPRSRSRFLRSRKRDKQIQMPAKYAEVRSSRNQRETWLSVDFCGRWWSGRKLDRRIAEGRFRSLCSLKSRAELLEGHRKTGATSHMITCYHHPWVQDLLPLFSTGYSSPILQYKYWQYLC